MGPLSREVTCKIQKWNIDADGFHPILVANARVDWLALKDDDITNKILLEGILKDVFLQRASSDGKVLNHKNSLFRCFSQGPALRQSGVTCCNPDANSGPH